VDAYPFDRFTADAKRVLVYAQQEAEDAGLSYVGTEHLLLGLFRLASGSGYRALQSLGVDQMKVRADLQSMQEAPGHVPPRPTKALQRAIVHAFEESRRHGTDVVRTAHLLAGLALVSDAVAADLLKRQWAQPDQVLAAVERELGPS
jgi:ATP-dependent Clp protease ATP-binding subunit ClpC